jgi:hypothetical protein
MHLELQALAIDQQDQAYKEDLWVGMHRLFAQMNRLRDQKIQPGSREKDPSETIRQRTYGSQIQD